MVIGWLLGLCVQRVRLVVMMEIDFNRGFTRGRLRELRYDIGYFPSLLQKLRIEVSHFLMTMLQYKF